MSGKIGLGWRGDEGAFIGVLGDTGRGVWLAGRVRCCNRESDAQHRCMLTDPYNWSF